MPGSQDEGPSDSISRFWKHTSLGATLLMLSPTPRRTTSVFTTAVGPQCLSSCSTRERGRTCSNTGTFGLAAHGHNAVQLLFTADPLHYVLPTNEVRRRCSDFHSLKVSAYTQARSSRSRPSSHDRFLAMDNVVRVARPSGTRNVLGGVGGKERSGVRNRRVA